MTKRDGGRDRFLEALRRLGDGDVASVGMPVTVIAGAARIEGSIARAVDFAGYVDTEVGAALRRYAESTDDAGQRGAAEALAEKFEGALMRAPIERQMERRVEIGDKLRELSADDPNADELRREGDRLETLGTVVLLRDARVWGPGFNPLQGPTEVPFVRIPVGSISAWWLGHAAASD